MQRSTIRLSGLLMAAVAMVAAAPALAQLPLPPAPGEGPPKKAAPGAPPTPSGLPAPPAAPSAVAPAPRAPPLPEATAAPRPPAPPGVSAGVVPPLGRPPGVAPPLPPRPLPPPFVGRDVTAFAPHELRRWRGGQWRQDWHRGRYGWWWMVGGLWYFYPQPVYPYPSYVSEVLFEDEAPNYAGGYWYYCHYPPGYYPYVQYCEYEWQPMPTY